MILYVRATGGMEGRESIDAAILPRPQDAPVMCRRGEWTNSSVSEWHQLPRTEGQIGDKKKTDHRFRIKTVYGDG